MTQEGGRTHNGALTEAGWKEGSGMRDLHRTKRIITLTDSSLRAHRTFSRSPQLRVASWPDECLEIFGAEKVAVWLDVLAGGRLLHSRPASQPAGSN